MLLTCAHNQLQSCIFLFKSTQLFLLLIVFTLLFKGTCICRVNFSLSESHFNTRVLLSFWVYCVHSCVEEHLPKPQPREHFDSHLTLCVSK